MTSTPIFKGYNSYVFSQTAYLKNFLLIEPIKVQQIKVY